MSRAKQIALRCRILAGGFSGERVVLVTTADGKEHKGMAPRQYCWTKDKESLGENEPVVGQAIDGYVAALEIAEQGNNALVSTPDGDVFAVRKETIVPRPQPQSEIASNVSV